MHCLVDRWDLAAVMKRADKEGPDLDWGLLPTTWSSVLALDVQQLELRDVVFCSGVSDASNPKYAILIISATNRIHELVKLCLLRLLIGEPR